MRLILLAISLPVIWAKLETNKWQTQKKINQQFCGTESYELKTRGIWCKSWWLPPQRWDTLIIDAAKACAVCAYGGQVGCATCGAVAVKNFFIQQGASHVNAINNMGGDVQRQAGEWLGRWWEDILKGKWYHSDFNGWRVEARGGWETYRSRECALGFCGPWTSAQTQAYVQFKVKLKGHFFKVKNSCHKKVQVAIRYKQPNGQWTTKCWWSVSPQESIYLASGGDRLITENSIWYYYAEAVDGSTSWWGNDNTRTCRGRSLKMKKKDYVDSKSDLYVGLSCNNRNKMSTATEVGEEEVVAQEPKALGLNASIGVNASVSIESPEPKNRDEGEEEGAKELLP